MPQAESGLQRLPEKHRERFSDQKLHAKSVFSLYILSFKDVFHSIYCHLRVFFTLEPASSQVWWSPWAHPDTILGEPPARLDSVHIFFDNYYVRTFSRRLDRHPVRRACAIHTEEAQPPQQLDSPSCSQIA